MALIKCPECGNNVSDKAELCPHCGHPVAVEQKKERYMVVVKSLPFLLGYLFISVGPFLPYMRQCMNMLGKKEVLNFNMLSLLTPEAAGVKSGEGAGLFGIIPIVVIILGIIGIIIVLLQRIKYKKIPLFVSILIPIIVIILIVIFEVVGLKMFYENSKTFTDIAIDTGLGEDFFTLSKGIGFYTIVAGVISSFFTSVYMAIQSKKSIRPEKDTENE